MPRYEYRCEEHFPGGITINKGMQYASDPEPCPKCERIMEKVFQPVNGRVQRGTEKFHMAR